MVSGAQYGKIKMVFYVLIVVLSIAVAYKKSVAQAQPLGKTTTGEGGAKSGIETSDKNIAFIVGGIGGSILMTLIYMYYRNRALGGGSSESNYRVR